ncbi:MAG: hypothetical protein JHC93_03400 [Parachlamydiales bacterium]|nr:hypothetical protein [Parachlamydiales bacterium]
MADSESIPFLAPVHYFSLAFDCHYLSHEEMEQTKGSLKKKYLLPTTEHLCEEASFADVYMAWNDMEIAFHIVVHEPCTAVYYPDITYGDSIEIFIDTRDNKDTGFNHRFCHHFFVLPKAPEEGPQAAEITRFRTEDSHEWCDSAKLQFQCKLSSRQYEIFLKIPVDCLHGYDPEESPRLGFTYRINRYNDTQQHFCVCSKEFMIDQQPSLWSSVRLIK